jgi:hypothetical protein
VLDSGLAAALVVYGLPPAAAIGAVLAYHAISIWVPGCGGIIALLSTRRTPLTDQPPVPVPAQPDIPPADGAPAKTRPRTAADAATPDV